MKPALPVLFIFFILVMSACSTAVKTIHSTRQPDVILANEITRIVLIDRSKPSSRAATVVEGIFTGEWMGSDRQGRKEVLRSIDQLMAQQDRFQIVRTDVELEGSPSGALMKKPMRAEEIMEIAKDFEADAVLTLEAFDSDGQNVATEAVSLGVGIWTLGIFDPMNYPNNVRTSWRLYDGIDGTVLDEYQTFNVEDGWWAYATMPPATQFESVSAGAQAAAFQYAGRLIPMPIQYQRRFYKRAYGANKKMLEAHRLVRAERWDRATQIWQQLYEREDSRKVRRRAAYNLAVAAERQRDLDQALNWIEQAVALGDNPAIAYSADLTLQKEHQVWYESNQYQEESEERESQSEER